MTASVAFISFISNFSSSSQFHRQLDQRVVSLTDDNEASINICAGRIPFAFLEDIHQRFVKTYARTILSAPAYAMNDEFSRVLSQQMDHYSNDPNADRLNRLKGEMSQASSKNYLINSV